MATRAERQQVLEQMTDDELEAFQAKWGGSWFDKENRAKSINSMLGKTEKKNLGNDIDHLLGLPTDAEQQLKLQLDSADATDQQLKLQHESIEAAKSSSRAAWISAGCALVAIVLSIIALWIAIGKI